MNIKEKGHWAIEAQRHSSRYGLIDMARTLPDARQFILSDTISHCEVEYYLLSHEGQGLQMVLGLSFLPGNGLHGYLFCPNGTYVNKIPESAIPRMCCCRPSISRLSRVLFPDQTRLMNLASTALGADTGNFLRETEVEELEMHSSHKVGVLYVKAGQTTEEEWLANNLDDASPGFLQFLTILGDRVTLLGFDGYSGGLDTEHDYTGTESIYRSAHGQKVMYHVGPLLPYKRHDRQQVSRKKHIGNDTVVIVYADDPSFELDPTELLSKQIHAYILVQPQASLISSMVLSDSEMRTTQPQFAPRISDIFSDQEEDVSGPSRSAQRTLSEVPEVASSAAASEQFSDDGSDIENPDLEDAPLVNVVQVTVATYGGFDSPGAFPYPGIRPLDSNLGDWLFLKICSLSTVTRKVGVFAQKYEGFRRSAIVKLLRSFNN